MLANIDPSLPSPARIYDFWLGGTHNFAADRAVAARAVELLPELPAICRQNRAFLGRAVRFALSRGIRQFLDLGGGIPAPGDVRETARAVRGDARIAHVDREPTAVLHARALLDGDPGAVVVQADILRSRQVLDDPGLRALIDFTEPVCILLVAVLHFLPDSAELTAALRDYREAVVPGSLLVVSHATGGARPEQLDRFADLYHRTGTPMVLRDEEALTSLLQGWEPVAPGIVHGPDWLPDPGAIALEDPASYHTLTGVALRP